MKLNNLPKRVEKRKRRLGQGHGSGRVKTSGRGTKGQNSRGHVPLSFEGGALPLIKRLPFLRGKGRNVSFRQKAVVITLESLNNLKKGTIIDKDYLFTNKIIEDKSVMVKILGDGEVNVPLTIKVSISKSAAAKIEKAGGKIEVNE